jgi:DNA polymerase-3 subunit epsilon
LHDGRVRLALVALKLRPWPFAGAIGIRERSADGAGSVLHVIDRWRHLGTAADDADVADLLERTPALAFDADSYRIVARCLERLGPRDVVVLARPARRA